MSGVVEKARSLVMFIFFFLKRKRLGGEGEEEKVLISWNLDSHKLIKITDISFTREDIR